MDVLLTYALDVKKLYDGLGVVWVTFFELQRRGPLSRYNQTAQAADNR